MTRSRHSRCAVSLLLISLLSSCGPGSGNNPALKGVVGPVVSVTSDAVMLNAVYVGTKVEAEVEVPVPGFPASSVRLAPDAASGGTLVSLKVGVQDYLASKGAGLELQPLPGGRALPGVVSGTLPAETVSLPVFGDARFFVSPEAIGLFVPSEKLKAAPNLIRTYRFYDPGKKPAGMIALVGDAPTGGNAGLLVLMSPDLLGIKGPAAREAFLRALWERGFR